MAAARSRGGKVAQNRLAPPPPADAAPAPGPPPAWTSLSSPRRVRQGFAWAVREVIAKRLDTKEANAIGQLLAGAIRTFAAEPAPTGEPTIAPDGVTEEEAPRVRVFLPEEVEPPTTDPTPPKGEPE